MIVDPDESNPHQEPCISCGEETAVGSIFFSDRHTVDGPDGTRTYLCSECIARIHSAGHREGLSDTRRGLGLSVTGVNALR
jgi:hypothetical protein